MKILVVVAVITFFQYIIIELTFTDLPGLEQMPGMGRGIYVGPLGLLGNVAAYSGIDIWGFRIIRLTGMWVEPSVASGYLFMAFFLAQALHIVTEDKKWKWASILCFMSGIMTLSNTGYLAVAGALVVGQVFAFYKRGRYRWLLPVTMLVSALLLYVVLFGRSFVLEYFPQNEYLAAIVGLRGEGGGLLGGDLSDPMFVQFAGRDVTALYNLEVALENPWGIGFRIPGEDPEGLGFIEASGTAVILWLTYTGFIGLLLLMLREIQVVRAFMFYSDRTGVNLKLFQAWVVLFIQNMSYGDLMTGVYFLVIALLFSSCYHGGSFISKPISVRLGQS